MPIIKISHLRCPKCGYKFYYKWLPGASFTSVRLGKYRYTRCPRCKHMSMFNVWNTRVSKTGRRQKRYNDVITTITYLPMIIAFVLLVVFTSILLGSYTYLAVELIVIEISAMLLTCFSLIFKILPKEEA